MLKTALHLVARSLHSRWKSFHPAGLRPLHDAKPTLQVALDKGVLSDLAANLSRGLVGSWVLATVALGALHAAESQGQKGSALNFEQHVRPILKAHCFDCHGEGDSLRGGLDVRLKRFILQGGESGPALVPGKPESSRLWELLQSGKMPKRDRKPTPQELEIVRDWIAAGAPTLRDEPETLAIGMQITPEERSHWAFKPIRRPAVPKSEDARARHPIDAFLAKTFRERGLKFNEDAAPEVLVRRAFLDLWGLPPTPSDLEAFRWAGGRDAYSALIQQLLDSPRYGERWARHWLDVAGYADSDGYTNDDSPRPYAYKYRDYVIRAMNRDVPFDRFIVEQLAGDELALVKHPNLEAAAQDPEAREWLVATGFLRMAADGTASGGVDQDMARNAVVSDTVKIVSTSLMALTVGCAQCHDHRYEPIPQTDYYRMRAVFEPAYDWKNWKQPSQRLVSLYTPEARDKAAAVEKEAAALSKEKEAKQSVMIDEALKKHLEKMDAPLREPLWNAFKTPTDKRTPEQKKLLADHPSANIHPGVLYQYNPKAAEELKAMDAKIAEVRAKRPVEDFVSLLSEPVGTLPVTYRFHRGDPRQPKEEIAPGTLSVLSPEGAATALGLPSLSPPTSRRRLALAQWMTGPNNPLTARVIVNRVWMHHFGRGLVGTPADFGLQGEKPSHPELLDWLASVFSAPACDDPDPNRMGLGWSLKKLHRLIMESTAYRVSSARTAELDQADPENRLYARRSVLRLDAEAIRDSFLAVSGALSEKMFGPPVPVREDVVGQIVVGIDQKQGDNKMPVDVPMGEEEFRRSVYVEVRRSKPLAFLNSFDAPVMEVNCERRQVSTVAPQSLMLMNSEFTMQQAGLLVGRLKREAGPMRDAQLERAWKLVLGRSPRPSEWTSAREFLDRQVKEIRTVTAGDAAKDKESKNSGLTPEQQAMRSLCQALLSANEFLYVD